MELRYFGAVIHLASIIVPSTQAGRLYLYELGNPDVGAQYRVANPWLMTAGVAYDSSMVDDKDRTPDLPMGEAWRFGLGARYDWSRSFAFGAGYTFLWSETWTWTSIRGLWQEEYQAHMRICQ